MKQNESIKYEKYYCQCGKEMFWCDWICNDCMDKEEKEANEFREYLENEKDRDSQLF